MQFTDNEHALFFVSSTMTLGDDRIVRFWDDHLTVPYARSYKFYMHAYPRNGVRHGLWPMGYITFHVPEISMALSESRR
jgi:hypothetical protein